MHTKIHGKHVFECDACGDALETETADWDEALKMMRNADWWTRKIGADYVHTCVDCTDEAERNAHGRRKRH